MAILTIRFSSQVLKRKVTCAVCLPTDNGTVHSRTNPADYRYPTIYLLHGLTSDYNEWLYRSHIEKYSERNNIAVVMPNAENSFYVNSGLVNDDFDRFIGQEIVEETRRMLPLSDRREDTFIGGDSMGGFGAMRLGLKYADTFSKILSFSAAIHMFEFEPGHPYRNTVVNEDRIFGDYETARNSEMNPAVVLEQLAERVAKKQAQYPDVFMICGLQDSLLQANRSFHQKLLKHEVPVIYQEHEGDHSHFYWDQHLEEMLQWALGKR